MITTPHFQLADYSRGNPDTPKMALLLPGFLDTKDYPDMYGPVDYLAGRDYYAISFDAPGTWESKGSIKDYTMTNYLRAVQEVIAHFGSRPTVLIGKSMGGLMAVLAATREPAVTAVITTVSSYAVVRQDNGEEQAAGVPTAAWKRQGERLSNRDLPENPRRQRTFTVPYSFVEDARQYNSLDILPKLTIPKLLIASEQDTLVTPKVVKTSYEVAAQPKQYYLLKGADHDYRKNSKLNQEVTEVIGDFLTQTP